MRKIQDGDLNTEISVLGNDEVGELAFHFKKMMQKINELISVVMRKQAATKDAEIRALQTQINAHFIYNVLETIRMMALLEKKPVIADTVNSLAGLMRYSMSWKRQYVPLRQEVESVRNYMNLVDVRYDFEVKLLMNIEERFYDHEILKMTLQPIVENSFTHGIEPYGRDGSITIETFVSDGVFIIDVTDNGMGMTPEHLANLKRSIDTEKNIQQANHQAKGNGIGLRNVNERIMLYYGSEYGLEISSEEGNYTKVRVRLPYWKDLGVEA
jgi:two-component system sensor histidine kinase YesM